MPRARAVALSLLIPLCWPTTSRADWCIWTIISSYTVETCSQGTCVLNAVDEWGILCFPGGGGGGEPGGGVGGDPPPGDPPSPPVCPSTATVFVTDVGPGDTSHALLEGWVIVSPLDGQVDIGMQGPGAAGVFAGSTSGGSYSFAVDLRNIAPNESGVYEITAKAPSSCGGGTLSTNHASITRTQHTVIAGAPETRTFGITVNGYLYQTPVAFHDMGFSYDYYRGQADQTARLSHIRGFQADAYAVTDGFDPHSNRPMSFYGPVKVQAPGFEWLLGGGWFSEYQYYRVTVPAGTNDPVELAAAGPGSSESKLLDPVHLRLDDTGQFGRAGVVTGELGGLPYFNVPLSLP